MKKFIISTTINPPTEAIEKFDNLKNDRLPVTLDDLENMWNEDRNNYNNTNNEDDDDSEEHNTNNTNRSSTTI